MIFHHFSRQIEQLRRCEIIKESEVKTLCAKARQVQYLIFYNVTMTPPTEKFLLRRVMYRW